VQPVSVACTALDGLPLTQSLRPFYAWYGDMTLLPHLWQAFKCDGFTVDVVFHPPFRAAAIPDRKELAAAAWEAVASGAATLRQNRPVTPVTAAAAQTAW